MKVTIIQQPNGTITAETASQIIETLDDGKFDAHDLVSLLVELGVDVLFKKEPA